MRRMSAAPQFQFDDEHDELLDGKMGFLEHLDELRTRLIRACIALAIGMLVAFAFVDRLADFVLQPTLRMLPPGSALIVTKPGENFSFYLDVAFIGGLVLAAPFIMFQVWRFIWPGLWATQKKLVIPLLFLWVFGKLARPPFRHPLSSPGPFGF